MATTKEYRDYVLENIELDITYKPMMGEYLLYYNNVLFGGIYDDRLLVKKTGSNQQYSLEEVIPYPNAKAMYLVDIDNTKQLKNIIINAYNDLL